VDNHDDQHDHGHDHHGHDHDHGHEHDDGDEELPDISEWSSSAQTTTCPACDAPGAVTLGGGIFCPTCGQISTNAGYQAPAPEPEQD
jgi:hypothetical protein